MQSFLRFVVEQTLDGQAGGLKERTIGVEALGRRLDYDPKVDPIVRVQARRLREKLAEYYQSQAGRTELQIGLPKGSYVPEFLRLVPPEPEPAIEPLPEVIVTPARRGDRRLFYFLLGSAATILIAGLFAFRHTPAPLTGSARVRLFVGGHGTYNHPAFSPDGTQLAFDWGGPADDNTDIYVQRVDSDQPVRLTSDTAPDRRPCWSPDGKRIAFLRRTANDRADVMTVDVEGGGEQSIASIATVGDPPKLDWSPDGSTLITSVGTAAAGLKRNLILIAVASGSQRALTSPPVDSTGDNDAAFSPDGSTVAFIRAKAVGVQDIYLTPVQGGEPRRLTSDNTLLGGLAWQHDSKDIVFISTRDGSSAIWTVPARGGTPVRVTAVEPGAAFPTIAPQGRRIAFAVRIQDENIWRVDADGGNPPVPVIDSPQLDSAPSVSPDGATLAFSSRRTGASEIWVSGLHGESPRRLTHVAGAENGGPEWSVDGKNILFTSARKGPPHVWVVPREGGEPRRLTSDTFGETSASWSRDGRSVYYASSASGISEIWKKALDGGPAVQITHDGAVRGQESFDGSWLYFTKGEEKAGLWRQPLSGGPAELVASELPERLWGAWRVTQGGVFFLSFVWRQPYTEKLYFYDQSTGTTRLAMSMPGVAAPFGAGLGVSPDGRSVYFVQVDRWGVGLYLADDLPR